MKVIFISDTHGRHKQLPKMNGDMIIHAGDITSRGTKNEVLDFLNWFRELDFEHKIFIAGNHDYFLEELIDFELEQLIPKNIVYLNDSGITINELKIWGSPIQPWFHDWAFNKKRGAEIKEHWDLIPNDTNILITHGPPYQILDKTIRGENVGCEELLEKILIVKPNIHVFGHIHEDYGIKESNHVKYINASSLDVKYNLVNPPIEVNI